MMQQRSSLKYAKAQYRIFDKARRRVEGEGDSRTQRGGKGTASIQEEALLMPRNKTKPTPGEQRKRFMETARELGIPDTEAAQERAFGKVGLKKLRKKAKRK